MDGSAGRGGRKLPDRDVARIIPVQTGGRDKKNGLSKRGADFGFAGRYGTWRGPEVLCRFHRRIADGAIFTGGAGHAGRGVLPLPVKRSGEASDGNVAARSAVWRAAGGKL